MNREQEIAYYYQRAAEIRARGGSERLAQTMENYARNLEAGIYNEGAGWDIGASNRRWAEQEPKQRKSEQPRKAEGKGRREQQQKQSYYQPEQQQEPQYNPVMSESDKGYRGAGYDEPPMDYAEFTGERGSANRYDTPNQHGHTGAVAYLDDPNPRVWAEANRDTEPVNRYGHREDSFVGYLDRLRDRKRDW